MRRLLTLTEEQLGKVADAARGLWPNSDITRPSHVWDVLDLAQYVLGDVVPELRDIKVAETASGSDLLIMAAITPFFRLATGVIPISNFTSQNGGPTGPIVRMVLAELVTYRNGLVAQMVEHGKRVRK